MSSTRMNREDENNGNAANGLLFIAHLDRGRRPMRGHRDLKVYQLAYKSGNADFGQGFNEVISERRTLFV